MVQNSTGAPWKPEQPAVKNGRPAPPPMPERTPSFGDKMDIDDGRWKGTSSTVKQVPPATKYEARLATKHVAPPVTKQEEPPSTKVPTKRKASSISDGDVEMKDSMDGPSAGANPTQGAHDKKVKASIPIKKEPKSTNGSASGFNVQARPPGAAKSSAPGASEGDGKPPKKKRPVDPFIKPNRPKKPKPN